ncbi:MAG TPA: GNAT family N-acetyltransferase [Ktedonobacteraceae bacterium]|nr:GNAT family N-acetyltransferase [Ktedonobacteraceae bacterium]
MSQTRITIRPLRLTDAHHVYEIMHMPNVLWGLSVLPSTTADAWSTIVEQWVADEHMHVFVAEIQEKAIGIICVRVRTGRESHVGDVTLAVHDKHQRQGIGKMLLITALDLADNWLNLVRLELAVYTDNEQAIRLCQQFDFAIEGRKHYDAFRGGAYIDSYMLARLHIATNSINATNEPKETTGETPQ